jgi:pilus assembly protein CpaC
MPPHRWLAVLVLLGAALGMAALGMAWGTPATAQDATALGAPDSMAARPRLAAPTHAALAAPAHAALATQTRAALAAAATAGPAASQLALEAGGGRVVTLPGAAASVFAADPKVAEARPASATSLFIFGVAPGRTTIAALDSAGATLAQYDVVVRPSAFGAMEAGATLARLLPGTRLRVETEAGGMVVTGETATAAEAEQAMAVVRSYAAPNQVVDNRVTVLGATQVNLRVRFIEVDRSVTRQLGLNWQALGSLGRFAVSAATNYATAGAAGLPSTLGLGYTGAVNINAVIDALARDQLVTILAEPNLTAQSGETASFLAGGEYPIPVGQQNGQISIDFKQYGVALAFVPTVLSGGRISLRVRPEVSQLSTQGAVQLTAGNATLQIPALTVRRADTTVELGSGQSFAIAGLLQETRTQTGGGIPGLGEIPLLGALFHSDQFERDESELVIVITPYIVRPSSDPKALRGPRGATAAPASDLQRNLLFRQYARDQYARDQYPGDQYPGDAPAPPPPVPGDVGFVLR